MRDMIAERPFPASVCVRECGSRDDLASIAAGLYDALRFFSGESVSVILCPAVPRAGVGVAVMNRLDKASGGLCVRSTDDAP
jgi:L-threonylcarbamoyladenylate synthase